MVVLTVFGAIGLGRFAYAAILQSGLGLSNAGAGGLATISLIGYLSLALVGGALASRVGPRAVIAVALVVAGLGMFLTSGAHSFVVAASGSFLTGMGSGAGNVASMGLVSAWFGSRRRGFAAGVAVIGCSLGPIVAGPVVPWILDTFPDGGWRLSWQVFGALTIGLGVLGYVVLRDRPADKGLRPLAAGPDEAVPAGRGGGLHWGRVYRSGTVWHLGLVYVAFGFSYIIFMTFFYKRLITDAGYTREAAGNLYMLMGWCSVFCGVIWGSVADALGRKPALIMVYCLQAAAYLTFAFAATGAGFVTGSVLFGLTAWSIPAIIAAACGNILGARLAPAALGFITLFFSIGQAIGPSVAGAMADATGDFSSAFVLAGAVALAGALGSATLRPATRPFEQPVET
jgi:MFS family permease